ncbi:MAG: phospholipid scramblase-related protein [Bacteroidota bacterium]|nr:phospholipid scramblase-related protein [Bacteroidota bacterium]
MNTDFFDPNSYFIDQKVHFFRFENVFRIYDDLGVQIGSVNQKLTGRQKALRFLVSNAFLPFLIEIRDTHDELLFTLTRGWTFFMSRINILDAKGSMMGMIQQKFKVIRPLFRIFDNFGVLKGEISGDWKAWNFVVRNPEGAQIGLITKKWAGMKEIFTTADKYKLTVDQHYATKEDKIFLIAGAISIDMVLKEKSKSG